MQKFIIENFSPLPFQVFPFSDNPKFDCEDLWIGVCNTKPLIMIYHLRKPSI